MRILHFILGKANPDRANGVNQVIHGLAKYQSRAGHEVHVVGISSSMTTEYEKVQREEFEVDCFKRFNTNTFTYLKKLIDNIDIVHLHGVWNMKNVRLGSYLEAIGKPYIITAHCGYAIDRLKQSNYLAKLLYHKVWQKKLYEQAAGIHALSREESTDIYHFCKNNNIFVVANGVDPDTFDKYQYMIHKDRPKIKIGYLGRLSVEKNIDNLLKAISLLPNDVKGQVELCLIGPITDKALRFKLMVKQLQIVENVKFLGAKYGKDKINALLDLDFYIHPSYSEGGAISVMEALALGIPTIVTRTSYMSYFYDSNAFIMVEPTAFDLCRGIETAISRLDDRSLLSVNAKKLYHSKFNWKVAVDSLITEYQKVSTCDTELSNSVNTE